MTIAPTVCLKRNLLGSSDISSDERKKIANQTGNNSKYEYKLTGTKALMLQIVQSNKLYPNPCYRLSHFT